MATIRTYEAETEAAETVLNGIRKGINLGAEAADIAVKAAAGNQTDETFIQTLANEHPTLLMRVAKAVAIATMRRVTYNPEWKPFDAAVRDTGRWCSLTTTVMVADKPVAIPRHTEHDGRIDCQTVIGAELMARQSYI